MEFLKTKYQRDYWATVFLGFLMIVLVVVLAVNFFIAIRNSQISSRKEFLASQTELVSRQLEKEIYRFEIDANVVRDFIDDEDMDAEDYRQEFTETIRRVFNSYPNLIDSLWVDFQDSLISFEMTPRNDFIRRSLTDKGSLDGKLTHEVEGKPDIDLLFFINLPSFTVNFVADYYLDPEGAKYLIMDEKIIQLSAPKSGELSFSEETTSEIESDVELGLKGVYDLVWRTEREEGSGVAAQYPFDFGQLKRGASLLFLLKTDDLNSGIYSTYFYLFAVLVLILGGTVVIFTFSLNNNEKSRRQLETKGLEIADLFEQQSLLLQELKGFVFFHNYQGKITRVTKEVERILGRNLEEFQKAFQKDSRSEDVKRLRKYILFAVQKQYPHLDFEYDYVRRDGRKIRLRIFEKLHYDESGKFLGGSGICTDITRQYEARNELIQSENRLRNVIENIPDVISIYDNGGKILSLDIKDHGDFLDNAESLVGQNIKKAISKSQKDKIWNAFEKSRMTGRIQTVEWKVKIKNVQKYFEVRFFPLDNSLMMSLSKEITAQKVWEQGLIDAMNTADKANQAKSEFLANMSHEIRTPLNGLLGIIDLLEDTNLSKKQLQYLQIIKTSGNSLLDIIKDILDYSKIEAGKIELMEEVFNPADELEEVANIFLGMTQRKHIKLSLNIDEQARAWFDGDREKWVQVLFNLVGNAIKFTPDRGQIFIRLRAETLTETAYFIHCEIQDSGIGIPEENIPYLTDPFYQVESSSERSFQGTGLGLAIAKKIIEVMGGDLEIKSQVGEGSVFSFQVLLSKLEDQDVTAKEDYMGTASEDIRLGERFPLRILLAEDNDLNLELMSLMLHQMHYEFDVARNGLEVLSALKDKPYDLILMDVQMPILNGLEATRRIREGSSQSDVIIIGLSANVFDEDFKKAMDMGMDEYLTKPIRLSILAAKLEQAHIRLREKLIN